MASKDGLDLYGLLLSAPMRSRSQPINGMGGLGLRLLRKYRRFA